MSFLFSRYESSNVFSEVKLAENVDQTTNTTVIDVQYVEVITIIKIKVEDQISLMFHPQFTYMIFVNSYSYISVSSGISRTHLSMWLGSSVD